MPWVLSQVNRKWRSLCGLIEAVMPAAWGITGKHLADSALAVRLLPARLEQEHRAGAALGLHVQGEGFLECGREWHDAVLAALALGDPDAAGVEVDVGDADPDELGDPDPGVEQGLDEHDVVGPASFPDGVIEGADLGFGEGGRRLSSDGFCHGR